MIGSLFHSVLYEPLYNGLVFLISIMPGYDIGLAVIVLTVAVKFLILPLSHKAIKTQTKMKEIEPHIQNIKEKYKNDKQAQALKTMELYREHGVNPFSSFVMVFVQFPVILALYWVFWKGLKNGIHPEDLYSFISAPSILNLHFLSFFDLASKSIVLAGLAALSQFFQIQTATPPQEVKKNIPHKPSFKDEFMKSFNMNMKFGIPLVVFFVSYSISGVVALYWISSNTFTIIHQLLVRKKAFSKMSLLEIVKK